MSFSSLNAQAKFFARSTVKEDKSSFPPSPRGARFMKYPITVKRGPLSLIRNIILVEIFAGFLLVASVYVANYEKILYYTFTRVIGYNYSLVLATSLLQLIITFAVFLRWINESYEIREKEIIRKKGIFSIIQKSFPLEGVKEVILKQNLLERLTNCGTVSVYDARQKKILSMRNVENSEIITETLKSLVGKINMSQTEKERELSVLDFVLAGESQSLELKESFRWDDERKMVNKDLEKTAMKVIASFLNLDGGKLIFGVKDNRAVRGLEQDYGSLPRQDRDGFENHFNHVFNAALGARFRQFVNLKFDKIVGRDVCLAEIFPSDSPVYLKANNSEEFYVRTGNATTALVMSEAQEYIKSHWKES